MAARISKTEQELQDRLARALSTAMGYAEFDKFAQDWENAGNSPLAGQDASPEL